MFLVIEHHLNYQFCPELIGKKYYEKKSSANHCNNNVEKSGEHMNTKTDWKLETFKLAMMLAFGYFICQLTGSFWLTIIAGFSGSAFVHILYHIIRSFNAKSNL